MGLAESLFRGLGQGATFGMSDEAISGLGVLYAKTLAPELFKNQSALSLYQQALDQERQANAIARQQNPYSFGAAEFAGGFALPAASFGGGLSGALKAGAGYGGLAGYGYSNEKSIPKQAKDIAIGSMLGAGLGAAGYGAVKAAQNPEVQKLAKEFVTDESGHIKLGNVDSIKLYRGLTKEYDPSYDLASTDAPLGYTTWTDNPELAKQYAGKNGFVYQIDLPINKKGIEMIDNDGERYLFLNNQKKAGLNKISGDEYLVYNYHDDFSPNLVKRYQSKEK